MPDETTHDTSGGVFDKLAGKAKQAVGTLVGNDALAREGELQEKKVDTAQEAKILATEADQAERQSALTAEQEANRLDQQRVQAELDERARLAQIDRDEQDAKAAVAQEAARREAAVERQEQLEEAVLDRKEVDVVAERIDGAQEAAEIAEEARNAEAAAEALQAAQRDLEQKTTGG